MVRRMASITLLSLFCLMLFPLVTKAATIPSCTFNRDGFYQGETGYITVTVFNDEENTIRITEGTANIDYYYVDGNTYLQTFYSDTNLPIEIQPGQNGSFHVPFSLPSNIAPGYTTFFIKAVTQLWHGHSELWYASDHPTYQIRIYIESSYKQQYADQQATNDLLQGHLQELQAVNDTSTMVMYLLGLTTIIFIVATIFLVVLNRKPRAIPQAVV